MRDNSQITVTLVRNDYGEFEVICRMDSSLCTATRQEKKDIKLLLSAL